MLSNRTSDLSWCYTGNLIKINQRSLISIDTGISKVDIAHSCIFLFTIIVTINFCILLHKGINLVEE
uniref:Pco078161 n=1 Tax=Arundo donax TaxID=35708 RepID=A0A0A9F4G6_ARUDO